jgi:hypothetical protein
MYDQIKFEMITLLIIFYPHCTSLKNTSVLGTSLLFHFALPLCRFYYFLRHVEIITKKIIGLNRRNIMNRIKKFLPTVTFYSVVKLFYQWNRFLYTSSSFMHKIGEDIRC